MNCPFLWRVAAVHDGRLVSPESVAAERHIAGCTECRAERASLRLIAERLRAMPTPADDPMTFRRARQSLLERADALQTGRAPRKVRPTALAIGWAAVLVLSAATIWSGARRSAESASRIAPAASAAFDLPVLTVDVVPAPGADWSRALTEEGVAVTLRDGTVSIRVERSSARGHLFLRTPDAEVEDLGTVFSVSVAEGRTTAVVVDEGSVILRRRGEDPLVIGPRRRWSLPAVPVAAVPGPATPGGRASGRGPSSSSPTVAHASAAPSGAAPAPDDGTALFASASAALARGSYSEAATRLTLFLDSFPTDPRREDALYLRAVAFARAGRTGSARNAARTYLELHPNGFRAPEMRALAE